MTTSQPATTKQAFYGWRMVMLACIAQNLAGGAIFGTFGVLLAPVSETFNASISSTTIAISLVLLISGISSPMIGKCLDRFSIRRIMQLGALLMAVGLLGASRAESLLMFQICFATAGLGASMAGMLPGVTLVNRWFIAGSGKAIGITSLPVIFVIMPLVVNELVESVGWRDMLTLLSIMMLLSIIILQAVIDRPEDVGQEAFGHKHSNDGEKAQAEAQLNISELLKSRQFILIALGVSFASGTITLTAHLFNHAISLGFSSHQSALLLTIAGFSSMIGAAGFGTLADKIGARNALLSNIVAQMILWCFLIITKNYSGLVALVVLLSICGGGVYPVLGTLLSRSFGPYNLGSALGTKAFVSLPFNFIASPLAGWFFDQHGNYQFAFMIHIVMFLFSALLIFLAKNK